MPEPSSSLINGLWSGQQSIKDRALQFGDGCFTTIAVHAGEVQLWLRHWQRLQDDCTRLGIPLPSSWQSLLLQEITTLVATYPPAASAVVKIIISRGVGGRGYAADKLLEPQRLISISPYPEHYRHWQQQGITVGWAALQLGQQPALAGIKSLNRLEQVLLKQELAGQPHLDDLLVCDSQGWLIESIVANLFWYQQGQWFTPSLQQAGITGVVRAELLANNPQVQVVTMKPQTLLNAEAMFLCNALLGIVPVREIAAGAGLPRLVLANNRYPQQLNTQL